MRTSIKSMCLLIFVFIASILWSASASSASENEYEWIIIYYMPYDNNLSEYGEKIIAMIRDGVASEKVLVVIQADYAGDGGLKRYAISKNRFEKTYLPDEEESANEEVLSRYLNWVADNFKGKRHVLIFLDHGGKMNEISLDEYPSRKFSDMRKVAGVLKDFTDKINAKLDLLFFQVCARGTLENIYEFRDCAKYTLFSQFEVGAPNYYYTSTFNSLSNNIDMESVELCKEIMKNDTPEMYQRYTCVDNSVFDELKMRLNELLWDTGIKGIKMGKRRNIRKIIYAGQMYYDLVSTLESMNLADDVLKDKRRSLIDFIRNKLIVSQIVNAKIKSSELFSGVSILCPSSIKEFERIQDYRIYNESNLETLIKKACLRQE